MRLAALYLFAIGCGRVGFEGASDGGGGADAARDATDAAPNVVRMWKQLQPAVHPGPLFAPRLTFDGGLGVTLLYGGDGDLQWGAVRAAMWSYAGGDWTLMCDPCAPGPRGVPAFAYDPDGGRVLLYGGRAMGGGQLSDLWAYEGGVWSLVTTTGDLPGPRSETHFVHDPVRHRMMLVGGQGPGTATVFELFELAGTVWKRIDLASGPRLNSEGASVVWDGRREALVVYADDQQTADDLWTWDGAAWKPICTACTERKRSAASLVYDALAERLVLVGGFDGIEIPGSWQENAAGSFDKFGPDEPPGRDSAGLTYDPVRGRAVMFGGNGDSCNSNCSETWELVEQ